MFGNKLGKVAKLAAKNQAEKLAAMLNDKNAGVVMAAIDALGSCTGDAAFNALVPLVRSADAGVRAHAAAALGKMGLPKARTFLLHQRDAEKDETVLKAIDEALQKISVKM